MGSNKAVKSTVSMLPPKGGTVDLADVLPAAAKANGISIEDAIGIYMRNREAIHGVLGLLGRLFQRKPKTPKPSSSFDVPTTKPGIPGGFDRPSYDNVPSYANVPTPVARVIGELRLKLGIIQYGPSETITDKELFDQMAAGTAKLNEGMRLHFDITPVDVYGQPFQTGQPGHPEGLAEGIIYRLGWDGQTVDIRPGDLAGEGDNTRQTPGLLTVHSWHDDYGLTPVVKVQKTPDETGDHVATFQALLPPSPKTGGRQIASRTYEFKVNT